MGKQKAKTLKNKAKAKFVTKFVVQKKADLSVYVMMDSKSEFDLFKQNVSFFGSFDSTYNVMEIKNEEALKAFKASSDFVGACQQSKELFVGKKQEDNTAPMKLRSFAGKKSSFIITTYVS